MKEHTKIYAEFFGYKIPQDFKCELCDRPAVDIHHIKPRGMGGDPKGSKDVIENLMALCREDHEQYGDVPELRDMLSLIHLKYMKYNGLKSKLDELDVDIDVQIKNLESKKL